MTPTETRHVAAFLGDKYTHSGGGFWVLADDDAKPPMSDADLLLALLEAAARYGWEPTLGCHGMTRWTCTLGGSKRNDPWWNGDGPTPLSALIAAVVACGEKV